MGHFDLLFPPPPINKVVFLSAEFVILNLLTWKCYYYFWFMKIKFIHSLQKSLYDMFFYPIFLSVKILILCMCVCGRGGGERGEDMPSFKHMLSKYKKKKSELIHVYIKDILRGEKQT